MAIEQVEGFKTSDGSCYATKPDAYKAEILWLYRSLVRFEKQQPTPAEFRKFLVAVQEWLRRAESLQAQMEAEKGEMKRHLVNQE